MANPNPWKRDMQSEMVRLLRVYTDADGIINVDAAINDFTAWLVGNPQVIAAEAGRIARDTFDAIDRARRPKAAGAQLGLFDPHAMIPIARNERVWMEYATREHLIAWAALDDAEFARSATAHAEKSSYRSSRLLAWRSHHDYLIDVERDAFGWI